jgi:hypothetical protein
VLPQAASGEHFEAAAAGTSFYTESQPGRKNSPFSSRKDSQDLKDSVPYKTKGKVESTKPE